MCLCVYVAVTEVSHNQLISEEYHLKISTAHFDIAQIIFVMEIGTYTEYTERVLLDTECVCGENCILVG